MFEKVYVDEFGNMSDEDFHKELLGEDDVLGAGHVGLTKQRGRRPMPDEMERPFVTGKEKGKEESNHV